MKKMGNDFFNKNKNNNK